MVPQDAYMENLTTPLPPPPICVRRAGNISWRYDNERKNLNFHNFMKSSSGHLEITFSWLPWPKKTPWCQKLLLNTQISQNLKLFSGNLFFHRLPVDTWKAVLTTLLKDFCQVTENFRPSYQKRFIYLFYLPKMFFLKFFHLTNTM